MGWHRNAVAPILHSYINRRWSLTWQIESPVVLRQGGDSLHISGTYITYDWLMTGNETSWTLHRETWQWTAAEATLDPFVFILLVKAEVFIVLQCSNDKTTRLLTPAVVSVYRKQCCPTAFTYTVYLYMLLPLHEYASRSTSNFKILKSTSPHL